jgi:hypothetical protein
MSTYKLDLILNQKPPSLPDEPKRTDSQNVYGVKQKRGAMMKDFRNSHAFASGYIAGRRAAIAAMMHAANTEAEEFNEGEMNA